MPLLVIGIVRQGHPAPASGGEGPQVSLVESGSIAAAVQEIDEQTQLSEEDAARHLDMLILLLRDGPVLPMAFGTVSPDEQAVRSEVLDAAAADFAARLDAVDGLVETRLEILFDEPPALREVMQADPEIQALAEQTKGQASSLDTRISLGQMVSDALTQWRAQRAEEILPTLTAVAEDAVELESSDPLQQRWALLVRTQRLAELDEVVGGHRSALRSRASIEYVGPLPVYSFLARASPDPAPQRSAWGW